jgi:GH35 family endo-1,4-beta-xylanase
MNPHTGTGEEWRAMQDGEPTWRSDDSLAAVARARANIPTHRQRAIEIRLLNRRGQPVANTPVEIEQLRHAFCFGDQLWPLDALFRHGLGNSDRAKYWKHRFAQVLNSATALTYWTERPRNDGSKTEDFQGDPQLNNFAWCVDWANAAGLTVKGHPLFWSIDKCVPDWIKRYDYDTQMKFAEVRVRNLVARFRGKVKIWDAINEPLWEPAFRNLAQRHWPHIEPVEALVEYIEPVLCWCRAEDPDAIFLVNDYGLEGDAKSCLPETKDGRQVTAAFQRQRFLALAQRLLDRGTAPDALGMQAHTAGWINHAQQTAVYDELATAGLPLHVTEFWAETRRLQCPPEEAGTLQAEYVANYLTTAFGHPAIEAFFFWGFMNAAVVWRDDYSSHDLNPIFHRVRDLIHREWKTHAHLTTDRDGVVRLRAFYGDYVLRRDQRGLHFRVDRQAGMPLTLVGP